MKLQLRALHKREKLILAAMLAVGVAIFVAEIGFSEGEPQTEAAAASLPAAVPGSAASTAVAEASPAIPKSDEAKAETAGVTPTEAGAQPSAEAAAPVVANVFPIQTWQPPPPPPGPPPKPTAPPLPFQYSGQLLEGDQIVAFFSQQKRQHIAKAGDVIDNLYRVETITSQRIEFTYLPLKQKQELLTGSPP